MSVRVCVFEYVHIMMEALLALARSYGQTRSSELRNFLLEAF